MAAVLQQNFGVEPVLHRGVRGVLDVHLDGELIFSKHKEGRWPTAEELVRSIQERTSS
ncbi:MAG: hypothetical protein H6728_01145 [Myxococcales bacterium]|nr:hypothetical protein [Myxococcales bacterium]MCB9641661.1 hypothetical protein [Myxococcales bacterium]